MNNLDHVRPEVRHQIHDILDNPGTRFIVKAMVEAGLKKDCCDAVSDAEMVVKLLKMVRDDILK